MRALALLACLTALISGCTWNTDNGNDADYTAPLPSDHPINNSPGATPKWEERSRAGNPTTYTIRGITYNVYPYSRGYYRRGVASWYGKKFHGRSTSNGETYNMYAFTAAHKTLPIPCYARVTNLDNGQQIVVRINDRGPFVDERIIDMSYAAANALGMVNKGIANVIVETIDTEPMGYIPAHKSVIPGPDMEYTPPPTTIVNTTPAYTPAPVINTEPYDDFAESPLETAVEFTPENLTLDNTLSEPSAPNTPLALDYALTESKPAPATTPDIIPATAPPKPSFTTEYYMQAGAYQDYQRAATLYAKMHSLSQHTPFITTSGNANTPIYRVLIGPFDTADQARTTATQLANKGLVGGFVVKQ